MIQLVLRGTIPIPPSGCRGGCPCHPPGAGCGALVAIFMVAKRNGPPVAIGRPVAIAVHRPLLLLLLHRRRRRRPRLTIDVGDAIATKGTGLNPSASAAIIAVVRCHR